MASLESVTGRFSVQEMDTNLIFIICFHEVTDKQFRHMFKLGIDSFIRMVLYSVSSLGSRKTIKCLIIFYTKSDSSIKRHSLKNDVVYPLGFTPRLGIGIFQLNKVKTLKVSIISDDTVLGRPTELTHSVSRECVRLTQLS